MEDLRPQIESIIRIHENTIQSNIEQIKRVNQAGNMELEYWYLGENNATKRVLQDLKELLTYQNETNEI